MFNYFRKKDKGTLDEKYHNSFLNKKHVNYMLRFFLLKSGFNLNVAFFFFLKKSSALFYVNILIINRNLFLGKAK